MCAFTTNIANFVHVWVRENSSEIYYQGPIQCDSIFFITKIGMYGIWYKCSHSAIATMTLNAIQTHWFW